MKNKGFSLVELIIVIAIMAILIGIMAPQLIRYIEKANVSADEQMLDSIYSAVVYASVDPEVQMDPVSKAIVDNMVNPMTLESISANTIIYNEIISTLGWTDLNQTTYVALLQSAHNVSGCHIYMQYKGGVVNPIAMWITTTDASGKKNTGYAATSYNETDPNYYNCIHID